jgi:hypothetical protein
MFTTAKGSGRSLFSVLTYLVDSHPSAVLGRGPSRTDMRRTEDLIEQMPAHLRDDIGLPPVPPPQPEHPAIARARHRACRWGS